MTPSTTTRYAHRATILMAVVTVIAATMLSTERASWRTTTSKMPLVVDALSVSNDMIFHPKKHHFASKKPTAIGMVASSGNEDDENPIYDDITPSTQLDDEVDIAIIGAGIGGLAAGAILNTL